MSMAVNTAPNQSSEEKGKPEANVAGIGKRQDHGRPVSNDGKSCSGLVEYSMKESNFPAPDYLYENALVDIAASKTFARAWFPAQKNRRYF